MLLSMVPAHCAGWPIVGVARHGEGSRRAPHRFHLIRAGQRACRKDTSTPKNDRLINLTADHPRERAFLAAVETRQKDAMWSAEDSLEELASLTRTAGAEVAGTLIQRLKVPDRATYLGKGRAQEVAALHD